MSEQTVVDVIEGTLGALEPEMIHQAASLSTEQYVELSHAYETFAASYRAPERAPGELRPLVSSAYVNHHVTNIAIHTDTDLEDIVNVEATVDRIHMHLLYSHAVAIPDPLRYLADRFPSAPSRDVSPITRRRFENYLQFLSYLRPLIQAGVVVLLEDDLIASGGDRHRLQRLVDEVADHGDLTDFVTARRGLHGVAAYRAAQQLLTTNRFYLDSIVGDAIDGIMASLEISARHSNHLDLFLPFRFYRQVLQYIAAEDPATFRNWRSYLSMEQQWAALPDSSVRLDESLVVAELSALEIADFSLSARDVLAVRQGHEFEAWREALRGALLEVQSLRNADALGDGTARTIVAERLAAGRAALELGIGRSNVLRRARSGAKAFAVGALAALGLSPAIPAGEDIIKAAAGGVVTATWDLLSSRPHSEAALLQHYLQFTPLD